MRKECDQKTAELEHFADGIGETFIQRWDLHARQLDDGRYICIRKPLRAGHLLAHLKGELTLGAYVLDHSSQARYFAIDADDEDEMKKLANMKTSLAREGVPSYLERSRRGGHLWMFFPWAVPGKEARQFGHGLLKIYDLEGIELFPKQDQCQGGPGSLIRLPFGIHRKSGKRYGFITAAGEPIAATLSEQIRILSAPERVPESMFEAYRAVMLEKPQEPALQALSGAEETLSAQIKSRVTAYEFIRQYVDLSPSGRGLCPFHDDHHESFSVNLENNYWNCFAGCGGGSIIDFWMKLQDCDFATAVKQLAEQLL